MLIRSCLQEFRTRAALVALSVAARRSGKDGTRVGCFCLLRQTVIVPFCLVCKRLQGVVAVWPARLGYDVGFRHS